MVLHKHWMGQRLFCDRFYRYLTAATTRYRRVRARPRFRDQTVINAARGRFFALLLTPAAVAGYRGRMTAPTLHHPGTDNALLPVFAIRAELEANADQATLARFGAEVERAIRVAAQAGTVAPVNDVLRDWLRVALVAQDLDGYAGLPREARARRGEQLVDRWIQVNTAA